MTLRGGHDGIRSVTDADCLLFSAEYV